MSLAEQLHRIRTMIDCAEAVRDHGQMALGGGPEPESWACEGEVHLSHALFRAAQGLALLDVDAGGIERIARAGHRFGLQIGWEDAPDPD